MFSPNRLAPRGDCIGTKHGGCEAWCVRSKTVDNVSSDVPFNYKRIAAWDGARLILRTIHGLNNVREV